MSPRHAAEVVEDTMLAVKGFFECVGALGWALVLLVLDYLRLLFPTRKSFRGETILITGGASGIGRLMALRFAEYENVNLVIWDLNEEAMQSVAKELRAKGANAYTYKVDVSKRERVYEVAKQMKRDIGRDVTVLVNNAGIVAGKPFLEGDDAYSLKTMEVNAIAHFWTIKAFLPAMVDANHGHIITIASTAGLVGVDGLADYCCSKAAAISFHEGIRTEVRRLKRDGIHMTLVNPYFIDTGMFTGAKTKAPFLLPILKPDYVADSIIEAAVTNRNLLNLPRYAYILMIQGAVPCSVRDYIYDFMGIGENMADFKQTRSPHAPAALPAAGKAKAAAAAAVAKAANGDGDNGLKEQ